MIGEMLNVLLVSRVPVKPHTKTRPKSRSVWKHRSKRTFGSTMATHLEALSVLLSRIQVTERTI